MTTAHRPTWKAAVARADGGGTISTRNSVLDEPAHTSLKLRAQPIDKEEALKKSILALQEAEREHAKHSARKPNSLSLVAKKRAPLDPAEEARSRERLLKQTAEVDDVKLKEKYDDSDVDDGGGDSDSSSDLDASDDDDDDDGDSLNDSSSDDDNSDDEDDEAALQAELAKIRAERHEAKLRKEQEEAAEEGKQDEASALLGNPLLAVEGGGGNGNNIAGGRYKRAWNDDVVFRHQAKGAPAHKKRFINDTVRNDFSKRFLNKFIR